MRLTCRGCSLTALLLALWALPSAAQLLPPGRPATDPRAAAEEGMLTLKGHDDGITALAFSPDGKLLASGSGDRTIIIWDAHSGKLLHRLDGHAAAVTSLAFSPNGRYLLSSADEPVVDLWNTASWKIDSLYDNIGPVFTVQFLGDSNGFVTCGPFSLGLWQVGHAEPAGQLVSDTGMISAMTVANEEIIYGDRSGNVAVWDGLSDDPKVVHHRPHDTLSTNNPDGGNIVFGLGQGRPGHVLVCDRDGLWDWDRAPDHLTFLAKKMWGQPALLNHDQYLVSAYERYLWLRQPGPAGPSIVFRTGFPVHAVAVSPAGDLWAYGGRGDWSAVTEWHRGYASDVRVLRVDKLARAFQFAHAQATAAHASNPDAPPDLTAVKPDDPDMPGWDQ